MHEPMIFAGAPADANPEPMLAGKQLILTAAVRISSPLCESSSVISASRPGVSGPAI
jgi:hypothetical protein